MFESHCRDRLRTRPAASALLALAMIFKLAEATEKNWRRLVGVGDRVALCQDRRKYAGSKNQFCPSCNCGAVTRRSPLLTMAAVPITGDSFCAG